jgi:[ribosomal protein S18]-alanine N-acetyltransferase
MLEKPSLHAPGDEHEASALHVCLDEIARHSGRADRSAETPAKSQRSGRSLEDAPAAGWTLERILSEKALDEVIALDRASFSRPWTPAMFLTAVRSVHEFHLYALRRAGQSALAGFLCNGLAADTLQIATIAIRADLRRQGLGAMLIHFALNEAARVGAREATLDVRVSNLAARRLYHRMGFVPVALRPRHYDIPVEDGLTYARAIVPAGGSLTSPAKGDGGPTTGLPHKDAAVRRGAYDRRGLLL